MAHFEYHQPSTLAAAVSLLTGAGGDGALLAGGTALMVDIHQGKLRPRHVVSLWGVPGLGGIRVEQGGGVHLGALCTVTALAEAFLTHTQLRAFAEAARELGSRQIQNVATVGGNICKASPAADLVPPLLCCDAVVTLSGPSGVRQTALDGLLTGPGRVARARDEILTEFCLPALPPRSATAFLKIMRRRAEDLSIVAVAARVDLAEDLWTVTDCRIGLASVAPFPFRARGAESVLRGASLDEDRLRRAAAVARKEAAPISDVRASADYRRDMIEVLVRRAVSSAAARAAEGGGGSWAR